MCRECLLQLRHPTEKMRYLCERETKRIEPAFACRDSRQRRRAFLEQEAPGKENLASPERRRGEVGCFVRRDTRQGRLASQEKNVLDQTVYVETSGGNYFVVPSLPNSEADLSLGSCEPAFIRFSNVSSEI